LRLHVTYGLSAAAARLHRAYLTTIGQPDTSSGTPSTGSRQVTVPATATMVTVPPEFVASLAPGVQPFEVLAIEASGNQTLAEGSFVKP